MRREARSFVTLDGLRGVAAFAVMMFHTNPFIGRQVPEAFLAVDFFFALSGFVIAHAYTERLRTGMSPRSFLVLRLVRLYPLYILGTAIGILILPLTSQADGVSQLAIEIAAAVLFLPSPVTELLYPFNFPAWSLFHELLINGAFAALNNLLSRVVLCGIAAISAVILAGYAIWLGSLDTSNSWVHFEGGFVRVSFSFFAGVLVYRIWQKRPAPLNLPAAPFGCDPAFAAQPPSATTLHRRLSRQPGVAGVSLAALARSFEHANSADCHRVLVVGRNFLCCLRASRANDHSHPYAAYAARPVMAPCRDRSGGTLRHSIF